MPGYTGGKWAGCNAALPCSKDYLHVKDDPNNLRYGIYNRWIVFLWSRPCRRHSFRTLLFKIPFESNCLSITAYQPACQVPSIAIRLCEEEKKSSYSLWQHYWNSMRPRSRNFKVSCYMLASLSLNSHSVGCWLCSIWSRDFLELTWTHSKQYISIEFLFVTCILYVLFCV